MPRSVARVSILVLIALLAGVASPAVAQTPEPTSARGRQASPEATPTLQIDGFESRQGYRASLVQILTDIDLFWAASFETAGARYVSPSVTALAELEPVDTGCGRASADDSPAFYCPADTGIYFAPEFFAGQEERFGQFSWITILAHEWGHHVQNILAVERVPDSSYELQADCLAGAFTQDVLRRGQLEPGDVTSAVVTSADAGDPPWLPQDQPGAHGTNDDRITSFMRGYLDGLTGCNLPIAPPADGPVVVQDPPVANSGLAAALPGAGELPPGLSLVDAGGRSLEAIAASFLDPAEAAQLLAEWGWRENAYRDFATDDGTLTIQISLHRFATVDGAAAALPYYAGGRAAVLGLRVARGIAVGEQSATVTGRVVGGTETTVYARNGDTFVRVTLVSTAGDPTSDAAGLAEAVVGGLVGTGGIAPPPPALADALPLPSQAPIGLSPVEEGARGLAEIAASFPDPDAEQLLAGWGWRENAYRTFASADGAVRVEVSLHGFATPEGAAAALPYYADGRIAVVGVMEVPIELLGEQSVAVGGPVPAGNELTIYARSGAVLLRVSAVSATGDPAPLATAFARLVLGEGD